ncbi:hypothetical protein NLI96_g3849 [Meripilus lineatus]|uniref:MFS general substrate transporter n=1 Tax=Meripilus lineatus TaxID=2056292 RepID=A0AAD5V5Z9_9APHY|nr:hypothetical protein NLI96_g3849 [Physisporinus lineatus]
MGPSPSPSSWRSRAPAVLPLILLYVIAESLTEFSVAGIFQAIECQKAPPAHPPEIPCQSPEVRKAASRDRATYVVITTVLGMLVSGPFSRALDFSGRKKTVGIAVSVQLISTGLRVLVASYTAYQTTPALLVIAVIQGLGGGPIVFRAAHLALMSDSSSATTRSLHFFLARVTATAGSVIAASGAIPLLITENISALLLVSQGCWIFYLVYLTFILREAQVSSASASSESGFTPRSLYKATIDPLILFFGKLRHGLLWAGGVVLILPMAEQCTLLYFMHIFDSERASVQAMYLVLSSGAAGMMSLLVVLPLTTAFYRRRYGKKVIVEGTATTPTERTPLLKDETKLQKADAVPTPPSTTTLSPNSLSISQDLFVVRASFVAFVIGTLAMIFRSSVLGLTIGFSIYALASPFQPAIQSLASQVAKPNQQGRILTVLVVIDNLATEIINPRLLSRYGGPPDQDPTFAIYASAVARKIVGWLSRYSRFDFANAAFSVTLCVQW